MLWIQSILWVSTHCAIVSKLIMFENKEWIVGKTGRNSSDQGLRNENERIQSNGNSYQPQGLV